MNKYDIEIVEHMVLYETVYTMPLGYTMPMRDALHNFSGCDFEKGVLSRESHGLFHSFAALFFVVLLAGAKIGHRITP
ncbi:MAG: hypothetical protein PVF58_09885 [Candidatus Methanofastidiosia archaeon]